MAKLKQIENQSYFRKRYFDLESYLFSQCDPTALALFRMLFGFLMFLDVPQERGLEDADIRFSDPNFCFFPLFEFIQPLPVNYACILYSIMWIGSLGIMLGWNFRPSCLMYLVPYLYFYLLDKSRWNNHSYLFALTVILLFVSDSGKYLSLDKYLQKSSTAEQEMPTQIPTWNYFMLKFQLFILYFYAAIKKIDADWLAGYSMRNISKHQLFSPLSSIVDDKLIDYYMVHIGGFLFDLSAGFLLNIDCTRKLAFLLSFLFHSLNSQLFDIGMFPYVCLASLVLFCKPYEFPCNFFSGIPNPNAKIEKHGKQKKVSKTKQKLTSENKTSKEILQKNKVNETTVAGISWKMGLMALYVLTQLFLPFTHSITKGYNNWTNGLYGYSWDMMVYSWNTLHTKITIKNAVTGEERFLDPDVWTTNDRWSSHADMAKQYAKCIEKNLAPFNVKNIEVYFDIWKSLNGRFQQRIFNPSINILKAPWSPWENVPWILPLLTEFSHWRRNVIEIVSQQVANWTKSSNVIFVADYPGLLLENYLPEKLANISLFLLKGEIISEQMNQANITLKTDNDDLNIETLFKSRVSIKGGKLHKIHTISNSPSCYMYTYTNSTADNETDTHSTDSTPICTKIWTAFRNFMLKKIEIFSRSFYLIVNAYLNVLFDVPMVVRKNIDQENGN